jgi:hypothetical protein
MATMAHVVSDGIQLAVHDESPPTDAEWDAYLAEAASSVRGTLVVTDGGGPNAKQRAAIANIAGIAELPTAIITSSILARGIVTAISWLGKNIRAFSPAEIGAAMDYLGIGSSKRAELSQRIARLKVTLADAESLEVVAKTLGFGGDLGRAAEWVIAQPVQKIRRRILATS